MKRRDFLTVAAGATAVSIVSPSSLLAAEATTPLYVRGLAMLSFSDPHFLRIALPKAPHHKGTVKVVPSRGEQAQHSIEGHGTFEGIVEGGAKPEIRLPELVNVREIYRQAIPRLDRSPSVISIPWSAVQSISTNSVSEDRWTFVWADTGEEVSTFRPRKLAESIKIDLASKGSLRLNDGKLAIPLSQAEQVSTEFIPMSDDMGDFTEHFGHYMPYIETAADARTVIPKLLGTPTRRTAVPRFGNSFASVARVWPFRICFPFLVD